MKKKGFTLIELLAVIVILAVIALIAMPMIMNLIDDAKKNSAIDSGYGYLKALKTELARQAMENESWNLADGRYDGDYFYVVHGEEETQYAFPISYTGSEAKEVSLIVTNGMATGGSMIINNYLLYVDEEGRITLEGYAKTAVVITYDANGGNFDGETTRKIQYEEKNGNTIADKTYAKPTRDNYILTGWCKDQACTQEFTLNENLIPTEIYDTTVYAKWLDASLLYTYTTDDNGTTITGFADTGFQMYNNDELTVLEFPEVLNGKNVVAISPVSTDRKFKGKDKITEIILPSKITTISNQAFYGIPGLKKLTTPIEMNAGYKFDTTTLEEVHFIKGSTGIGLNYPTNGTTELTYFGTPWYKSREYGGASASSVGSKPLKVIIDDGITKIGDYMFRNNYRLDVTQINAKDVKEVGVSAFSNARFTDEHITLPSIETISNSAFEGSNWSGEYVVPSTVHTIRDKAFKDTNISGIFTLPSTVTTLGTSIFSGTNITEIVISNGITSIPRNTFYGLPNVKKLTIPIEIHAGNVFDTAVLEELHLTKGSTGVGMNYSSSGSNYNMYSATPWYKSREYGGASASSVGSSPLQVTIDSEITKIGDRMFKDNYRIQLMSSVSGKTIGTDAFTNSGAGI